MPRVKLQGKIAGTPQKQQLANIRFLADDRGEVEFKVDTDLTKPETGRLLRILADELEGVQAPRGSDSWGA